MNILYSHTHSISDTVLILGFFDGVHLGHQAVIKAGVDFAQKNNLISVLLTFDISAKDYFKADCNYIYKRDVNYKYIDELNVNYLTEEKFSELVNTDAEKYIETIVSAYSPKAIFCGYNYTFGKNKTGTVSLLKKASEKYNFELYCINEYITDNMPVSTTYIKQLLQKGEIKTANDLLSRPFELKSTVIKGSKIAGTMGYPTANMSYPENIIKIPYGVYSVTANDYKGILNWGVKPTFGKNSEILEVHLFNFEKNIYGQNLTVKLIKKIRNERRFNNIEELKQQIAEDIKNA